MKNKLRQNEIWKFLMVAAGTILFSTAINLFLTPLGLYNGGALGISQLIRTKSGEQDGHARFEEKQTADAPVCQQKQRDIENKINDTRNINLCPTQYRSSDQTHPPKAGSQTRRGH